MAAVGALSKSKSCLLDPPFLYVCLSCLHSLIISVRSIPEAMQSAASDQDRRERFQSNWANKTRSTRMCKVEGLPKGRQASFQAMQAAMLRRG